MLKEQLDLLRKFCIHLEEHDGTPLNTVLSKIIRQLIKENQDLLDQLEKGYKRVDNDE